MVLTEDDSILHPSVDEDTFFYIKCLNEGHSTYTRFFDALLIKRPSHRAFYRDLKCFREQPQAITVLQRTENDKTAYKEVTNIFLGSRFAHPWCRKTPLKTGFWRAEWGTIEGKKKDAEISREEEKLHKLLVPIWIYMKARMFPKDVDVKEWCERERERRVIQQDTKLTAAALQLHDLELKMEKQEKQEKQDRSLKQSASCADLQDDVEEQAQAAHAATSVFRLAAAGLIISQTPKRKLRWLVKKPK